MNWRHALHGFLIGTSDLIPGVSGGTIAVMLGIYDELLQAVGGIFSRQWRRHVNFLFPLGIGMGVALLALSRLVDWLLHHHFVSTQFFFLGLIVGILPGLWKQADLGRRFRPMLGAVTLAAASLAAAMAFVRPPATVPLTEITAFTAAGLFAAGALASAAMLLPGISGSFVLLLLGVYPTAIHALSTLHLGLIAIIGSGVAVGFVASGKLIRHMLHRHRDISYAAIIGLIIGSLAVIWPGWPAAGSSSAVSGVTFFTGLALTRLFGLNRGGTE